MEKFPRPFKCKFFLPPLGGCLFYGRERGSGVEFLSGMLLSTKSKQQCFSWEGTDD
jgi:hypothetical protein